MVMKLEHEVNIENPRHHSPERVETLRRLLAGGARVECDPKRPDFYEVESGSDIYYIHISPVTGTSFCWLHGQRMASQATKCGQFRPHNARKQTLTKVHINKSAALKPRSFRICVFNS